MKYILTITFYLFSLFLLGQEPTSTTFFKPYPENFAVKHAVEIEGIVPVYFTGGYSVGLGYRYKKVRLRANVLNGGTFNIENTGIENSATTFKRFYLTAPSIYLGLNVWRNLEVYTFLEFQNFNIMQRSTEVKKSLKSTDTGLGIGYQLFIGRYFYIQPGVQLNVRAKNALAFSGATYQIPTQDVSFVLRVGVRLWKKF